MIQRCQLHKIRNVKDELPERLRAARAGQETLVFGGVPEPLLPRTNEGRAPLSAGALITLKPQDALPTGPSACSR